MQLLIDTLKNTGSLHHAYVIPGERSKILPELLNFLEKDFGVRVQANPDFSHYECETFTIDDARRLKHNQNKKAMREGKRVFIISAYTLTREAQNSLLKVFEEPTPETYFFFIIPSANILLPTLQSRLMILPRDKTMGEGTYHETAQSFMGTPHAGRLLLLSDYIEEKNAPQAIEFLNHLESSLRGSVSLVEMSSDHLHAFEEIHKCRDYLHGRGSSVKGVLEYIALIVPIVKPIVKVK